MTALPPSWNWNRYYRDILGMRTAGRRVLTRGLSKRSGRPSSSSFDVVRDYILLPAGLAFGAFLSADDYMDKRLSNPSVQKLEQVLGNIGKAEEMKVPVPATGLCCGNLDDTPIFDEGHYPNGINHNFLQEDTQKIIESEQFASHVLFVFTPLMLGLSV
jgi:hypothetical protein